MILGTEKRLMTFKHVQEYDAKAETTYPFWLASKNGFSAGLPEITHRDQVDRLQNKIQAALEVHKMLIVTDKKPRI